MYDSHLYDDEKLAIQAVHPARDVPLRFDYLTGSDAISRLQLSEPKSPLHAAARNHIACEAVLAAEEGRWVAYSRRPCHYTGLTRYHGSAYTFRTVLSTIDEFVRLGLCEERRSAPGDHLRTYLQSRFRATKLLIQILEHAVFEAVAHEIIRLRNGEHLVNYRDTLLTLRMRRELDRINASLRRVEIRLPKEDLTRTRRHLILQDQLLRVGAPTLRRTFCRRSFAFGGRLYAWWQSLPQRYRAQLLLDGEAVTEADYLNLHAQLVYAMSGAPLVGDAYETGVFSREQGKRAFCIALNAKTPQAAIGALVKELTLPRSNAAKLLHTIRRKHKAVEWAFCSDMGVKLQLTDSEIMIQCLKACEAAEIPALPIHDSILAPSRSVGAVLDIMHSALSRWCPKVTYCSVKVKS